jgi:integrase/recombinase XerD
MKFGDGVKHYVNRKQERGIQFSYGEDCLTRFHRYIGDIDLGETNTSQVSTFLDNNRAAAVTWRHKYFTLLRFFEFWAARGAMPEMLMPPLRPKERQTFVPYIYSRAEVRALIKAAAKNEQSNISIPRTTMRTLIIALYGTGARIGEVLNLSIGDINLKGSNVTIGNRSPIRCRQIPIGSDLVEVLRRYLSWRAKQKSECARLFITKTGKPITCDHASKSFRRLREIANVQRDKRSLFQPRLQDLQFTFAVHRITAWIRNNTDLNRMLPALSVYMGLAGLNSTERYLHMTPERFKKHLNKLSPNSRRPHWRNDKGLMEFIWGL